MTDFLTLGAVRPGATAFITGFGPWVAMILGVLISAAVVSFTLRLFARSGSTGLMADGLVSSATHRAGTARLREFRSVRANVPGAPRFGRPRGLDGLISNAVTAYGDHSTARAKVMSDRKAATAGADGFTVEQQHNRKIEYPRHTSSVLHSVGGAQSANFRPQAAAAHLKKARS